MTHEIKRRDFFGATAAGAIGLSSLMRPASASAIEAAPFLRKGMSKTRVAKVYLGRSQPGWPKANLNLDEEVRRFEAEFDKLKPAFSDIEFVGGDLISSVNQLPDIMEKFKDIDGVLAVHLSLGTGPIFIKMLELKVPIVLFSTPYSGHEWHIVASLQKRGEMIEVIPSSDYGDLAKAVRPFRAIHRLKEAKVLYMRQGGPDKEYCKNIKQKFGTEIINVEYPQLEAAYHAADQKLVMDDAKRWINEAEKIVEPTRQEIIDSSRMYYALLKLLEEEKADIITIDCLGVGLMDKGLAYPCLGFSRLNGMGLGGVCEADLKSTMTQLIFQSLIGKTGFVTDPVIDVSNNTVIHAHCVSALKMDGSNGEQCPYIIRNHLEDARGVSLQVKMRTGQPMSLARLIGTDLMLFSTGEIIDTPDVDRGCRTKITTKVQDAQKLLENYSCGLHRVVFYGDNTQDLKRFCRFKDIRIVWEEKEDTYDIPGLEWNPSVHA